MMYDEIDFEALRDDLIDYFGTAMSSSPMAVIELSEAETASDSELIGIAEKNGFDIENYM